MAFQNLPPPPPTKDSDSSLDRWLQLIWKKLTTAGDFLWASLSLPTKAANTVLAGPTTGAAATVDFRALVAADLPAGTITGISDTASVDLTVTAGTLSAVVLPGGVDHSALGSLNTTNYTHLTAANHTDLTDGGDSTLHYHATDRALGNATGTLTIDHNPGDLYALISSYG